MPAIHFSIRTTLLLIIGVLTFLVATFVGSGVYRALVNEHNARVLKRGSGLLNVIYDTEKCLSLERGASVAILYVPVSSVGKLFDQMQKNRACEVANLNRVMLLLAKEKNTDRFKDEIAAIVGRVATLDRQRYALDEAMTKPLRRRPFELSDDIFSATTGTITAIQTLIEKYSVDLYQYNPIAGQQLRFKYYIWQLTEYAGREYALIGKLIVENRPPTRDQQIDLLSWRGRIEFGWEISRDYMNLTGLDEKLQPLVESADTKYLRTFDQIRDMFYGPAPVSLNRGYPITINRWLTMTGDAVDSLLVLKDASLSETQSHIDKLEADARRSIYLNLFMFICAAAISAYSLQVIIRRVIRPINAMADALYNVTRIIPDSKLPGARTLDEIDKLSIVLEAFRENTRLGEERKNYLNTVLATMMDGVIAIDAHGNIQLVNAAIESMFGYGRDELLGQNVTVLMPQPTKLPPQDYLAPYINDGNDRKREAIARRRDGSLFPVEMSIAFMQSHTGDTYVGTLRDITARKQADHEREQYLRDLENSNRELDDFAYITSHDLKEPLRGIHNFSRFLLEDYGDKLDAEGQQMLGTLSTLTQQMEGLLNTLLHYSRLGRTDLSIRPTNLQDVVDSVVALYAITLKEKNANVEVMEGLPVIVCDHIRIHEVFQNLVGNALKYNSNAAPKVEIGFMKQNRENVFFVRDNGIGIVKKNLESIFKIFHRLHARDAFGGGTGSGLTIAKKIVIQHGGRMWAESEGKDAGTTFYFTIPEKPA